MGGAQQQGRRRTRPGELCGVNSRPGDPLSLRKAAEPEFFRQAARNPGQLSGKLPGILGSLPKRGRPVTDSGFRLDSDSIQILNLDSDRNHVFFNVSRFGSERSLNESFRNDAKNSWQLSAGVRIFSGRLPGILGSFPDAKPRISGRLPEILVPSCHENGSRRYTLGASKGRVWIHTATHN